MLGRLEKQGGNIEDKRLQEVFLQQAFMAAQMVASHGNPLLSVGYANAIEDPEKIARQIAEFLDRELDVSAMVATVDSTLHREKA